VTAPLSSPRGEIVITPLAPGRYCVDHWSRHADSCGMLASDIGTYAAALAVARELSARLGSALAASETEAPPCERS